MGTRALDAARLFDLTGRTAIVTGASSGLGVTFAQTLAANGANGPSHSTGDLDSGGSGVEDAAMSAEDEPPLWALVRLPHTGRAA